MLVRHRPGLAQAGARVGQHLVGAVAPRERRRLEAAADRRDRSGRAVRRRRRGPRRRGRRAAASVRRDTGSPRGGRRRSRDRLLVVQRSSIRSGDAVLEVEAGERAEPQRRPRAPGSSASRPPQMTCDGDLLVHGVGLDVLGVVVDQLVAGSRAARGPAPSAATAASWSPRTPRGGRAPRPAADGAARRATSRCSARGSRAAPRRCRRRTTGRARWPPCPRAKRWWCSRLGSPAPYSSYSSSTSAALARTPSRGTTHDGRVGLLEVVDRADPEQLEHLLAGRVAVHVRGERGAVVLGDPVEEVVGEARARSAAVNRARSRRSRSLLERGAHPEQLRVPLEVVGDTVKPR